MKATHKQVDALMKKVKDPNLTNRIFDIMKDGAWRTWANVCEELPDKYRGYCKQTICARISDIQTQMGYRVKGEWYVFPIYGRLYLRHMPLKNGKPIPCPPKEVQGLKCWACRDDDGYTKFIIGGGDEQPVKHSGSYGFDDDGFMLDIIDFRGCATTIFPPSIKPGECEQVIIPMAVIMEKK